MTKEERRVYNKTWRENNKDRHALYEGNRKNNVEAYKRKVKNRNLKKYGINYEEFQAIIKEQNELCPICKLKLSGQIDVAHCHATGKVRGVLHNKCNRLLACCEDSKERLLGAIAYLERSVSP